MGSAHRGVEHWLKQRAASMFNLALGSWLVASLLLLPDLGYETLRSWLSGPIPPIALALLIVTSVWESRLGLQVVVEDYLQDGGSRFAALAVLNLLALAAIAAALYFAIRFQMSG